MQLVIAERVLRGDVSALDDCVAVLDFPLLAVVPLGEILAVEEYDRIRRRLVVGLARRDHLWFGPHDPALVLLLQRRERGHHADRDYNTADRREQHCTLAGHITLQTGEG